MELLRRSATSFPAWNRTPIPGMSLSAAGLLALADLSTVAQRTAIVGGASWLDSLLLVPGLHYQQAADELARESGGFTAVETGADGRELRFAVNNAATAQYIQRIARSGTVVTVDVGMLPQKAKRGLTRQSRGQHSTLWPSDDSPDLGWLSHLLYLISPVLTIVALTLMVLLQDWWGLCLLIALMVSRIINIWVIKQRAKATNPPPQRPPPFPPHNPRPPHHHRRLQKRQPHSSSPPSTPSGSSTATAPSPPRLTTLTVALRDGRGAVALRGMSDDLAAVTADAWLGAKTHAQGYLEAAAKLVVYLVAALGGNQTQAGALVSLALLLSSAGLLALSNAHARGLRVNGRVAAPYAPPPTELGEQGWGDVGGERGGQESYATPNGRHTAATWPGSQASGTTGLDDWAERGRVGRQHHVRDTYAFDDSVNYD